MNRTQLAPAFLACIVAIAWAAHDVHANMFVLIRDVSTGVRFEWSGSIDTTSLESSGPFNNTGGIQTDSDGLVFSSTTSTGQWFEDVLSGPTVGTSNFSVYPNILTGDFFAIHNHHFDSFVMPAGYISGTYIVGSTLFTGPSIESLGIFPGPHVFTIDGSPSTITVQAVPEASGFSYLITAIALGIACHGSSQRSIGPAE
jgi:hypothetical protein